MRQLWRKIPFETERDAEYERDRNEEDRGRERQRGCDLPRPPGRCRKEHQVMGGFGAFP
jgi:hypothetical protein